MKATRRGFLASLLAAPILAKLLPAAKGSPFPLTIKPLMMPTNLPISGYAMYNDRLFVYGRDFTAEPATIYVSQVEAELWR